jgi:hypothetical protein
MATKKQVEFPTEVQEYFRRQGQRGGYRRSMNMTPEERSESARLASRIRWGIGDEKKAAAGAE